MWATVIIYLLMSRLKLLRWLFFWESVWRANRDTWGCDLTVINLNIIMSVSKVIWGVVWYYWMVHSAVSLWGAGLSGAVTLMSDCYPLMRNLCVVIDSLDKRSVGARRLFVRLLTVTVKASTALRPFTPSAAGEEGEERVTLQSERMIMMLVVWRCMWVLKTGKPGDKLLEERRTDLSWWSDSSSPPLWGCGCTPPELSCAELRGRSLDGWPPPADGE